MNKSNNLLIFTAQSLSEIITTLKDKTSNLKEKEILEFEVLNPDLYSSTYNGKEIKLKNKTYIYRELKSWCELADIFFCSFLTPKQISQDTILIRFEKLSINKSFHKIDSKESEKYGVDSIFSEIDKNEEPSFLHYFIQALKNANIDKRINILNLGVNDANEFKIVKETLQNFQDHNLIGIDYCQSAINKAKERFKNHQNVKFYCHDMNKLNELNLEKFDLIISIGTFQSSNLNFKPLFMNIVQNYLKKEGAVILGFPNCRWIDGTSIFGARVKNYNFPEYSNLFNDVVFCKKYLQQKKYRVTITGKNYIFLTATSIIHQDDTHL